MPPQQPYGPNNQYDFIVSPGGPPKKSLLPSLGGQSSFTQKLIFIIGGAFVLIILMWIIGNILGGSGTNTADLTKLVQQQEEIARVSAEGAEGTSRTDIRNAATNTKLSVTSQQQEVLVFLAGQGTEIKEDQQKALENAATDELLETAKTNNTFDTTFIETMQSYLNDYSAAIQTAFDNASDETEQELLRSHFEQVKLLLEQLPKT